MEDEREVESFNAFRAIVFAAVKAFGKDNVLSIPTKGLPLPKDGKLTFIWSVASDGSDIQLVALEGDDVEIVTDSDKIRKFFTDRNLLEKDEIVETPAPDGATIDKQ